MLTELNSQITVDIRTAIVADADNLMSFINKCAGQSDFLTFDPGEYISVEEQQNVIASLLESKNGLLLIAEIRDKVIGTLTFRLGKRPKVSHVGEMGIVIDQDFWRMGVGTQLIQYLINWSSKQGFVRKINLKVRADHVRGIKLYEKCGFVVEGHQQRQFYSKGIFYDGLIMGLCIN